VLTSLLCITTANEKNTVVEGSILVYECGANCYLTVVSKDSRYHSGLCAAPICQAWNEKTEMPIKFKGRKVRITLGKGLQYDSTGNVMCKMGAFNKIEFLK
jgi:hypothetical protein